MRRRFKVPVPGLWSCWPLRYHRGPEKLATVQQISPGSSETLPVKLITAVRRNRPETLETLPAEMLLHIASYVPPATRAALALVSRTILFKISSDSLELQEGDRYELLLTLERDGRYMTEILCLECRIFHRPRFFGWEADPGLNCKVEELACMSRSHHLPQQVTFNRVVAITRCHRHNSTLYLPNRLESSHEFSLGQAKINYFIRCKFARGALFMKTVKVLMPSKDRAPPSVNDVAELVRLLQSNRPLGDCCRHMDWLTVEPRIFPSDKREYECIWGHFGDCPKGSCPRIRSDISQIGRCRHCVTEIVASAHKVCVTNAGVVVLTSWKNLGGGENLGDRWWKGHLSDPADRWPFHHE